MVRISEHSILSLRGTRRTRNRGLIEKSQNQSTGPQERRGTRRTNRVIRRVTRRARILCLRS